jgi:hypothetical protein
MRGTLRPLERPHRQHVLKPGRRAGRQRLQVTRPVGLREFQEKPEVSTRPKIQCSDSHGPRLPSENPPQGQQ